MPRIYIDDVEPLTTPLSDGQYGRDRAKDILATAEAFSHKDATFIPAEGVSEYFESEWSWSETMNPLIAAATMSFATHRPLQLTPDIIYNVILQGISAHVATDPEKYRNILVSHAEGKVEICIRDYSLVPGRWDNNWGYSIGKFRERILKRIPPASPVKPALDLSFTTTTPTDRVAHAAVLMDVLKAFYTYVVETWCGIPWIDVTGTKKDWISLSRAIGEPLLALGLADWNRNLQYILKNIISIFEGGTDTAFWNQFYYYKGAGESDGVARVDGWIAKLFLYIKDGLNSLAPAADDEEGDMKKECERKGAEKDEEASVPKGKKLGAAVLKFREALLAEQAAKNRTRRKKEQEEQESSDEEAELSDSEEEEWAAGKTEPRKEEAKRLIKKEEKQRIEEPKNPGQHPKPAAKAERHTEPNAMVPAGLKAALREEWEDEWEEDNEPEKLVHGTKKTKPPVPTATREPFYDSDEDTAEIPLADFPIGVTDTPFIWEYMGSVIPMTLRAGLVGVTVNNNGVLCPEVGWVIGRDPKEEKEGGTSETSRAWSIQIDYEGESQEWLRKNLEGNSE
ncbi:hypothetical protein HDV00_005216 [Rhizophlyctis rosea]|nr:hypothetical protein HDV00_005216 [Rhizophlyctis rosea]